MTTSERIFKLIEKKGTTQYRVGKDLGISDGLISDWKAGRSSPTAERLVKLAKYFGVTTDYLLGVSDECTDKVCAAINKLDYNEQQEVLQHMYNQYPKLKE